MCECWLNSGLHAAEIDAANKSVRFLLMNGGSFWCSLACVLVFWGMLLACFVRNFVHVCACTFYIGLTLATYSVLEFLLCTL
jgi:hypothetical protein